MKRVLKAPWAIVGLLVACAGNEHRLGGDQQPGSVGLEGGAGGATPMASSQPTLGAGGASATIASPGYGEPNAAHAFAAGRWQGYIENYSRFSSSDSLLLEFDSLSAESTTGKIVFGNPEAQILDYSDPDQSIPMGAAGSPGSAPPEGYPFTLVGATFTGGRLRFSVSTAEVWEGWCAQQVPIPDAVNRGRYNCEHNTAIQINTSGCFGIDPRTQARRQIGCGRLAVCLSTDVCSCTATACSTVREAGSIQFDLTLRDLHLDGSVAGLAEVLNVHLTKL